MRARWTIVCLLLLASMPALAATRFQVSSTSGTKNRMVVTTKPDSGFVVLSDGTRLDGKIQLHIINDDTMQVRLWVAGEKDRREYDRASIHHFGLKEMSEDQFKVSKDETMNFQPGSVKLADGQQFTGRVATVKSRESGPFPTAFRFIPDKSQTVAEYDAAKLLAASQTVAGQTVNYERCRGVMLPLLIEGALVLARNPYPTTTNAFLSGVANIASSEVDEKAKKEIAKGEAKHIEKAMSQSEGKSFDQNMSDLNKSVQDVQDHHITVETSEVNVMAKEFLVRRAGETEWKAVTAHNVDDWAGELFAHCHDYQALDDSKRNDLRKFSKIEDCIRFFNEHCVK